MRPNFCHKKSVPTQLTRGVSIGCDSFLLRQLKMIRGRGLKCSGKAQSRRERRGLGRLSRRQGIALQGAAPLPVKSGISALTFLRLRLPSTSGAFRIAVASGPYGRQDSPRGAPLPRLRQARPSGWSQTAARPPRLGLPQRGVEPTIRISAGMPQLARAPARRRKHLCRRRQRVRAIMSKSLSIHGGFFDISNSSSIDIAPVGSYTHHTGSSVPLR